MKQKYTGWSKNNRPFSPSEFKNSYLGEYLNYSSYLMEFAKQYKDKTLRKELVGARQKKKTFDRKKKTFDRGIFSNLRL